MADLVLFTGSLLFTGSPISPQLSSEIIVLVVILVLALCLHLGGVRHLRFGRCGRFETELLLRCNPPPRIYQLCFAANQVQTDGR